MPFGNMRKITALDGKTSFEQWLRLGSVAAVRRWMFAENILNSSGKPFTRMSITRSAWIYAARNPEESFNFLKSSGVDYSRTLTLEKWLDDVAFHASTMLAPSGFKSLAEKYPQYKYQARAIRVRRMKIEQQRLAKAASAENISGPMS